MSGPSLPDPADPDPRSVGAIDGQLGDLYALLLEESADGVIIARGDGTILASNETARLLLGRTGEELAGSAWPALFDGEPGVTPVLRALSQRARYHGELGVVRSDGGRVPVQATFLAHGEGEASRLAILLRDISEWRRVQVELESRVRQQATLAELGGHAHGEDDVRALMDTATLLVRRGLNISFSKILEYDAEADELVLRSASGLMEDGLDKFRLPASDRSYAGYTFSSGQPVVSGDIRVEDRFRPWPRLLETGAVSGAIVLIPGVERPFGVLCAFSRRPERFADSDVHFLQVFADTLGQVIRRTDMQAFARYQASLLDAVNQAVVATDTRGVITYWNDGARRLYGWSAREAIGQELLKLVSAGAVRIGLAEIMVRLLKGRSWSGEVTTQHKDGTQTPSLLAAAPLHGPDGRVIGLVGTASDLTERKRLEAQLMQAQKMEAVGNLAGGVAHDFNNILTTIQNLAVLLLEDLGPERSQLHDDIADIAGAAERGARLTGQLLAFSRRDVQKPRRISANRVVQGLLPLLRRLVGERIAMSADLDPGAGTVFADPSQIERVLMNLVVNARDAVGEAGTIRVQTRHTKEIPAGSIVGDVAPADNGWVCITVADTGAGIDAETREHLFEPFFTTKPRGRGTGLGLATVYGIVSRSRGYVGVESEPGQGATFRVFLPAVSGTAQREAETTASYSSAAGSERGEVVLVVEDDNAVRRVTRRMLNRLGYRVIEASNGAEALHVFTGPAAVDVVLTDTVMPEMGGRELVERLASLRPDLPVIFMSGYTSDRTLRIDPDVVFLPKPFTPERLDAALRRVLEPAEESN